MKRRDFLTTGAMGAGATALASPALAQSAPVLEWRLQSSYPKSLDTIYGAAEVFAKAVLEASDGNFRIQVFAAGEIVPPLAIVDGVRSGTVEMGQTGSYFYIGLDPAFAFGTSIPFGPNTRFQQAWFTEAGGNDLFNEFLAGYDIHHLPLGGTGAQMGGWFRKEIASLADLKGLKMRIGGLSGMILQRLGLVPSQIAAGDVYPSLERGTIDAAEFVGPYDDEKLGLSKIAPYYYYPGFWEGAATLSLFIGLDKWTDLPERYRSILTMAAGYAGALQLAKYDAQNAEALRRLVAGGAQIRVFPGDVLQASYDAANAFYAETSAKSPAFKTLYDHQMAFRDATLPWLQISEYAYDTLLLQASQAAK